MFNRKNNVPCEHCKWLKTCGQRRNHCLPEANFASKTMFSKVDEQGNFDRKHNVSATMFSEVGKQETNNVSTKCFLVYKRDLFIKERKELSRARSN